jgi:hypothetical protein
MNKKSLVINTILIAALFCGGFVLAQAPVQDIDGNLHANLAAAQAHVVQAFNSILAAQKQNSDDMQGHAEKARQFLIQANQELKLAALSANAAQKKK